MVKLRRNMVIMMMSAVMIGGLSGCTTKKTMPVASPSIAEELSQDEKDTINLLTNKLNELYTGNAHISLHVGPEDTDLIYLMYNSDKMCYTETEFDNSVAMYQGNGKCVIFTDPVQIVDDISVLEMIENSIELVNNGSATVEVAEVDNANGDKIHQNKVIISGRNNIKQLYLKYGEDYANNIMASIFGDMTNENPDSLDTMTIEVDTNSDGAISAVCNITMDGSEYVSWWFDGYIPLGDWKFSGKLDKEYSTDEWKKFVSEIQTKIAENTDKYKKENFSEEELASIEAEISAQEESRAEEFQAKLSENTTVVSDEETEANSSLSELAVLEYGLIMEDNLKKDGLEGAKPEDYGTPNGMTDADRISMIEIYNTLKTWKEDRTSSVLTTPLNPEQLVLAQNYIEAAKKQFTDTGKDDAGSVFWMDTVGTHVINFKVQKDDAEETVQSTEDIENTEEAN